MKRCDKRRQECVSVPLTEYCDLLMAADRAKALAVDLAVAREANEGLQRMNDMLGAAVYSMVEEERERLDNYGVPPANVTALAPTTAERTDLPIYFRLAPKKAMPN